MAADSAVTVEQVHKHEIIEKVYNSANKIFTLSKWHPVGVMVFNTMTLGGTPWEVIVKQVRRELARREFATLQEYADFFFGHMQNNPVLFPVESARDVVFSNILRLVLDLRRRAEANSKLSTVLDESIQRLEKVDDVDGFSPQFTRGVMRRYDSEITAAIDVLLRKSHQRGQRRKLKKYVSLALSKKHLLPGWSGIVIAGFGREDIFPQLIEYRSDIVVSGRVRFWENKRMRIDSSTRSFVEPFADTEVIKTMMEGINPRFKSEFLVEALKIFLKLPEEILSQVTELQEDRKRYYTRAAGQPLVDQFKEFVSRVDEYRRREHIDPIAQTLQVLPISELAVIAETLLNASQIHKRVNPELETVGGPIDVAVISKGDGFVWIKRKHYFDDRLNPAFSRKYLDL